MGISQRCDQLRGSPVNAKVTNALKLPHGGILVEVDTAEGANNLSMGSNRTIFAKHLGPSAVIRPRSYNVVAYLVPLTFDIKDSENLRELELVNKFPPDSISSARWIKPEAKRQPHQLHALAIFSFTTPQLANQAIAEGLTICHKRVDVVKDKREPTRCMKCPLWGHIASVCNKTGDTCGTCGKDHRTSACSSPTLRYCTPCLQEGHASWDRHCPSFVSKQARLGHYSPRRSESQDSAQSPSHFRDDFTPHANQDRDEHNNRRLSLRR